MYIPIGEGSKQDEIQKEGGNNVMKNKKGSEGHDKDKKHEGMNRRDFIKKVGYAATVLGVS